MPTTSATSKITIIETVYPPISNQEAVWLKHDPEVERLLRESDFYMIGGRAQAKYRDVVADPDEHVVTFEFVFGDEFYGPSRHSSARSSCCRRGKPRQPLD